MTVTLLLVVALTQIFNSAAKTWQHGEAQVDAYREARGALQFMARDLSATLQAQYSQTSATTATSYSPALPTLVLQRYADPNPDSTGPINEEVYCLTNIPNSGSSSLCAVGYFCQWMPTIQPPINNCPQAYALMRQALNSNDTFARIQTATLGAQTPPPPLTFENFFSGSVLGKNASPQPTQLAAYIWDLRFRIDTDLSEATVQDGNSPPPYDHTGRQYVGDGSQKYPPRLPPYVEIRFKALSDLAGRRLEGNTQITKSNWSDTPSNLASAVYRTIIQPNAQQFVLRVPLINATPPATPAPPTPTP